MSIRVVDFKTQFRPGKEPVDMVLIAPAGPGFDKTRTWHRVSKIIPPKDADDTMKASDTYKAMVMRWDVVGPAYKAWKEGNEIPEEGTPLAAWGGVTSDQVGALKGMGIYTVEQVCEMGDKAMQELRIPNARQLPGLAKKFLESENTAVKDAKITELEERLAVMQEMLEEQQKTAKRGPGRPKKTEAA